MPEQLLLQDARASALKNFLSLPLLNLSVFPVQESFPLL